MSRPEDEDFLGRWSARKLKARTEAAAEPLPAAPPEPPAEVGAENSDAEVLKELGLPDPESLMKGDDFKAFLRAGIPARLRARALRRLWVSDPVLANLDGLNDYDQDFTDKATVRPDLKTAYRVGKGYLREASQPAASEAAEPPDSAAGLSAEEGAAERSSEGAPPIREPDGSPAAEAKAEPDRGRAVSNWTEAATGEPADIERRGPRMRIRFEVG